MRLQRDESFLTPSRTRDPTAAHENATIAAKEFSALVGLPETLEREERLQPDA